MPFRKMVKQGDSVTYVFSDRKVGSTRGKFCLLQLQKKLFNSLQCAPVGWTSCPPLRAATNEIYVQEAQKDLLNISQLLSSFLPFNILFVF